jgi:hypothetical protein
MKKVNLREIIIKIKTDFTTVVVIFIYFENKCRITKIYVIY